MFVLLNQNHIFMKIKFLFSFLEHEQYRILWHLILDVLMNPSFKNICFLYLCPLYNRLTITMQQKFMVKISNVAYLYHIIRKIN